MVWAYNTSNIVTPFPDVAGAGMCRPYYHAGLDRVQAMAWRVGGASLVPATSFTVRADRAKLIESFNDVGAFPAYASLLNSDGSVVSVGGGRISKFSSSGHLADTSITNQGTLLRVVLFGGGYLTRSTVAILGFDSSLAATFSSGSTFFVADNPLHDLATDGTYIYVATTRTTPSFKNAFILNGSGAVVTSTQIDGTSDAIRVVVGTDGSVFWVTKTGSTSKLTKTNASLSVLWTISISVDNAELAAAPSGGVYVVASYDSGAGIAYSYAGGNNVFRFDSTGTLLAATRIGYPGPTVPNAGFPFGIGDFGPLAATSKPNGSRLFIGGLARYFRWQAIP